MKLLKLTESFFRHLVKLDELKHKSLYFLARIERLIGDVRMEKKYLHDAQAAYEKAIELLNEAESSNRSNVKFYRMLSLLWGRLSELEILKEQIDRGLHFAELSAQVSRSLYEANQLSADVVRDMIMDLVKLSEIRAKLGQLNEAADSYKEAKAIVARGLIDGDLSTSDAWMEEELAGRIRLLLS